jgi:hypothetical protein
MSRGRRITLGVICGVYLAGTGFLTGVVVERVRVDRIRTHSVRRQQERQRLAREAAIRVELQHVADRVTPSR